MLSIGVSLTSSGCGIIDSDIFSHCGIIKWELSIRLVKLVDLELRHDRAIRIDWAFFKIWRVTPYLRISIKLKWRRKSIKLRWRISIKLRWRGS